MSVHNFVSAVRAGAAGAASGSSGFYDYQIEHSMRFRRNDETGLYRTLGTPTNVDKLTLSCWMKRNLIGNYYMNIYHSHSGSSGFNVAFDRSGTDDTIGIGSSQGGDGTSLYRDTTGWMNIVMAWDSTQGSNNDRFKFYVNGVERDEYNASFSQNDDIKWNISGYSFYIGRNLSTSYAFDGYLAEIIGIDGQQLLPTSFGELKNGVWKPIDPSGLTFGNNGFHLKFGNASSLGTDSSGNSNNFTVAGSPGTDHQSLDSPTFGS